MALSRADMKFELSNLKEDILIIVQNNKIENNDIITSSTNNIEKSLINFERMMEKFAIQIRDVQDANTVERIKLDKIDELIRFKDISEASIFGLKSKITNLSSDYLSSCFKYDRIFMDNLEVPGLIGEGCEFKNLKEWIEQNVKEMENITYFKEKILNEFKNVKASFENSLKGITELQQMQQNSEKNLQEICARFLKNTEENLKLEMATYEGTMNNIKLENGKYHLDALNQTKSLKNEQDQVIAIREELLAEWAIYTNNFQENCTLFEEIKNEFAVHKKNNVQQADIKDIRKKIIGLTTLVNRMQRDEMIQMNKRGQVGGGGQAPLGKNNWKGYRRPVPDMKLDDSYANDDSLEDEDEMPDLDTRGSLTKIKPYVKKKSSVKAAETVVKKGAVPNSPHDKSKQLRKPSITPAKDYSRLVKPLLKDSKEPFKKADKKTDKSLKDMIPKVEKKNINNIFIKPDHKRLKNRDKKRTMIIRKCKSHGKLFIKNTIPVITDNIMRPWSGFDFPKKLKISLSDEDIEKLKKGLFKKVFWGEDYNSCEGKIPKKNMSFTSNVPESNDDKSRINTGEKKNNAVKDKNDTKNNLVKLNENSDETSEEEEEDEDDDKRDDGKLYDEKKLKVTTPNSFEVIISLPLLTKDTDKDTDKDKDKDSSKVITKEKIIKESKDLDINTQLKLLKKGIKPAEMLGRLNNEKQVTAQEDKSQEIKKPENKPHEIKKASDLLKNSTQIDKKIDKPAHNEKKTSIPIEPKNVGNPQNNTLRSNKQGGNAMVNLETKEKPTVKKSSNQFNMNNLLTSPEKPKADTKIVDTIEKKIPVVIESKTNGPIVNSLNNQTVVPAHSKEIKKNEPINNINNNKLNPPVRRNSDVQNTNSNNTNNTSYQKTLESQPNQKTNGSNDTKKTKNNTINSQLAIGSKFSQNSRQNSFTDKDNQPLSTNRSKNSNKLTSNTKNLSQIQNKRINIESIAKGSKNSNPEVPIVLTNKFFKNPQQPSDQANADYEFKTIDPKKKGIKFKISIPNDKIESGKNSNRFSSKDKEIIRTHENIEPKGSNINLIRHKDTFENQANVLSHKSSNRNSARNSDFEYKNQYKEILESSNEINPDEVINVPTKQNLKSKLKSRNRLSNKKLSSKNQADLQYQENLHSYDSNQISDNQDHENQSDHYKDYKNGTEGKKNKTNIYKKLKNHALNKNYDTSDHNQINSGDSQPDLHVPKQNFSKMNTIQYESEIGEPQIEELIRKRSRKLSKGPVIDSSNFLSPDQKNLKSDNNLDVSIELKEVVKKRGPKKKKKVTVFEISSLNHNETDSKLEVPEIKTNETKIEIPIPQESKITPYTRVNAQDNREFFGCNHINKRITANTKENSNIVNPNTHKPKEVIQNTNSSPNTNKPKDVIQNTFVNPNTNKPKEVIHNAIISPNTHKLKEFIHNTNAFESTKKMPFNAITSPITHKLKEVIHNTNAFESTKKMPFYINNINPSNPNTTIPSNTNNLIPINSNNTTLSNINDILNKKKTKNLSSLVDDISPIKTIKFGSKKDNIQLLNANEPNNQQPIPNNLHHTTNFNLNRKINKNVHSRRNSFGPALLNQIPIQNQSNGMQNLNLNNNRIKNGYNLNQNTLLEGHNHGMNILPAAKGHKRSKSEYQPIQTIYDNSNIKIKNDIKVFGQAQGHVYRGIKNDFQTGNFSSNLLDHIGPPHLRTKSEFTSLYSDYPERKTTYNFNYDVKRFDIKGPGTDVKRSYYDDNFLTKTAENRDRERNRILNSNEKPIRPPRNNKNTVIDDNFNSDVEVVMIKKKLKNKINYSLNNEYDPEEDKYILKTDNNNMDRRIFNNDYPITLTNQNERIGDKEEIYRDARKQHNKNLKNEKHVSFMENTPVKTTYGNVYKIVASKEKTHPIKNNTLRSYIEKPLDFFSSPGYFNSKESISFYNQPSKAAHDFTVKETKIDLSKLNKMEKSIYDNLMKTIEKNSSFKQCMSIQPASRLNADSHTSIKTQNIKIDKLIFNNIQNK